MAGSVRQWNVDVRPLTCAGADVLEVAPPGWIELVSVERNRQNRRIRIEGVLCSVAVVNVPVDDCDALDAKAFTRVKRRQRCVTEQAVATSSSAFGMVTGRANE